MAISIKGVNTGVIRKANEFIALALKIKEPRNKESLFFLPVLELRDLLIAVESRLYQKQQLNAAERQHYEKTRDNISKKMQENIPAIVEDELRHADIHRRVTAVALTDGNGDNITLTFTLHDGNTCILRVNELQIEVLVYAIIRAIENAGMRELALRLSFCRCMMRTAWTMSDRNSTPTRSQSGNTRFSRIILRYFIVLRMKQERNGSAALS